jgi:CheY-like chemotaxis protein
MNSKSHETFDILLVEDNPADARLITEFLSDADFINDLHIQQDGIKAMNFLNQQCKQNDYYPNFVILDLNLPGKNGLEVLKEIKGDNELKKIPVMIFTTSTAEEDIKKCYDNHASCYITKPLDFDEFTDTINLIKDFWINTVKLP